MNLIMLIEKLIKTQARPKEVIFIIIIIIIIIIIKGALCSFGERHVNQNKTDLKGQFHTVLLC